MRDEARQALWAIARRVVFTGLVLAGAWAVILLLRWAGTAHWLAAAEECGEAFGCGPGLPPNGIDWSISLWTQRPVGAMVAGRMSTTLRWLSLGSLFALVLAGTALAVGTALCRANGQRSWPAGARRVLGDVLLNAWVTLPAVGFGGAVFVLVAVGWPELAAPRQEEPGQLWWPAAVLPGLLASGLMVEMGLGDMARWREQGGGKHLALLGLLALRSVASLLRMTGGLLALALVAEWLLDVPGTGTLLFSGLEQQDFPLVLAIAWELAVAVALAKLAADTLEIGREALARRAGLAAPVGVRSHREPPWPWLVLPSIVVLFPMVLGASADLLAPYPWIEPHYADNLVPPGSTYLLGTDYLGRDQLSRILFAFRFSLIVGLAATAVVALPAAGWGWLATSLKRRNGFRSQVLHDLVLMPAELLMVFPWPVLGGVVAILLFFVFPYRGLGPAIATMSLLLLPRAARMMEELHGFSPGERDAKRVARSVLVMLALAVGAALVYELTLSFVGYGMTPPYPDLGHMLSEESRLYMLQAPWLATWPALALAVFVLGWPFLGNTLAERFGFRSRAAWSKFME